MKRAARGITRITMFGEDQPQAENRIELASDKDEFGMPLARLIHSFDDDAIALWNANFDQGMKIAKATNAKEAWPGKGPVVPTSHLHGGAIMGTGPENSVTNSFGQTHEIPNLCMAGPVHLPDRGRVESDLHDLRRVAARRGAAGEELGERGGVIGQDVLYKTSYKSYKRTRPVGSRSVPEGSRAGSGIRLGPGPGPLIAPARSDQGLSRRTIIEAPASGDARRSGAGRFDRLVLLECLNHILLNRN